MASKDPRAAKLLRLAQVSGAFTPSAPVSDADLFADRPDQFFACFNSIFQKGLHIALYGERGVGKTSLANVLPKMISQTKLAGLRAVRLDCNTNDTYNSIWRKVFKALKVEPPAALQQSVFAERAIDPEEIRFTLEELQGHTLVVIDEFDRVEDDESLSLLADTVKTLADHSVDVTLMFVGVAASVSALLGEHESIVRHVRQVQMPRMTADEVGALLDKGFGLVDDLELSADARDRIIFMAEGLPHYAHLLGLNAGQVAVQDDRSLVELTDVELAAASAVATHTMADEYRKATHSAQPGHRFEEVLLACAYAQRDGLGYFRAGDVRAPLSAIVGQEMGIPRFQRHLNALSDPARGALEKHGEKHHYVYRFRDPLFQPFVKMTGLARNTIDDKLAARLQQQQAEGTENAFEAPM